MLDLVAPVQFPQPALQRTTMPDSRKRLEQDRKIYGDGKKLKLRRKRVEGKKRLKNLNGVKRKKCEEQKRRDAAWMKKLGVDQRRNGERLKKRPAEDKLRKKCVGDRLKKSIEGVLRSKSVLSSWQKNNVASNKKRFARNRRRGNNNSNNGKNSSKKNRKGDVG